MSEIKGDRRLTLLKAAYELLKSCNEGPYVKNVLAESVFYDEAECDGYSLMNDIKEILFSEDIISEDEFFENL